MDPAADVHGELTSQNVLFKSETVEQAAGALGVGAVVRAGRGLLKNNRFSPIDSENIFCLLGYSDGFHARGQIALERRV